MRPLISFDWAIKRLLRQKANFSILEGFLPWGLTPVTLAAGTLYGSGTPYATAADRDKAMGTSPALNCSK